MRVPTRRHLVAHAYTRARYRNLRISIIAIIEIGKFHNLGTDMSVFFRTSKRAVLDEKEEGRRKRTAVPPVVVTQVIRRDYDQAPEPATRRRTMEQALNSRLSPRVTPITDDYEISNHVLGLGINGKVVQCYNKITRQKYALKVSSQRGRKDASLQATREIISPCYTLEETTCVCSEIQ